MSHPDTVHKHAKSEAIPPNHCGPQIGDILRFSSRQIVAQGRQARGYLPSIKAAPVVNQE